MIKNEKQYKISKKYLDSINADIEKVRGNRSGNPIRVKFIMATLLHNKEEVEKDLITYESLKKNKKYIFKARMIGDLPLLLIEYKIVMGYTQKEFADKLGLKEQQLQRYEAEDYKSVTFKNLLKFIQVIGVDVQIMETRVKEPAGLS